MTHCSYNRFCSALSPVTRSHLCEICTKTTHAAGTEVTMDFYKHFLVVEGLCVCRHNRSSHPYRPGDLVITPHANTSRPLSIASVSFDERDVFETKVCFIHDTTLAYFDKRKIDELLEDPGFLMVSYRNLENLYAHLVAYFIAMESSSAYDSVKYLLQYCKHNGIEGLTHEQIALMTSHSRTTVTSIMHEIALAEPELLQ